MKISKIVTAVNDNVTYIEFLPMFSMMWNRVYPDIPLEVAYITDKDEDDPLVKRMREFADIRLFKKIPDVPDGIQAKITRLWLASNSGEDVVMLADVDYFVLNKKYPQCWYDMIEGDDNFVTVAGYTYTGPLLKGKHPIQYTAAKGSLYKEIVNPNDLPYLETLKQWFDVKVFDTKERINQPFNNFSDESLLRALKYNWIQKDASRSKLLLDVVREDGVPSDVNPFATQRLDRLNWKVKKNKLESDWYIDCAPVRPFINNLDNLRPVFEHFGFDEKDLIL